MSRPRCSPQVSPTTSVAACLTLKGDGIYADGGPPFIYLNGSPVADGRAYADFNLWFSINSEPPVTLSAQTLTFPTPMIVGNPEHGTPGHARQQHGRTGHVPRHGHRDHTGRTRPTSR